MEDEEAILGVALRFEEAAAPNMGGCGAAVQERRANHQEAMALQGIFFSAHEGNDVGPGEGEGAIDTFGEIRGATACGVVNEPVFAVDARISGPAAQSFPEKFVAYAGRRKTRFQWLAIELRKTKTGGAAADIAQRLDTMLRKECEKDFQFEI